MKDLNSKLDDYSRKMVKEMIPLVLFQWPYDLIGSYLLNIHVPEILYCLQQVLDPHESQPKGVHGASRSAFRLL